ATPSLLLGKLVHAGLEIFYRHRQLDVHLAAEDVAVRMRGLWPRLRDEAGLRFDTPKEEDALQAQGVALVQTYLAQADKTERPLAVELAIEAPLVNPATGEDLGLPMLGIIDLVVHGEAGPTIVDFKTAARGGEAVELLHELQLSSYAFLVRQSLGLPEAALEIRSLIKTKVPKVERHTYPAREMRHFGRLFAVLRAYVDAINIGRFHYRPGFHCQCCDFRETQCRGWCG
ncbi:MAG: PD-(D/E)XK nuclease family protein, partial [Planctomycetota bacterium]